MLKARRQKETTKKRIIDAAIEQFGGTGLTVTRIDDIAKAADVSHGTIFAYFFTHEELIETAIQEFGDRMIKRLHERIGTNSSLQDLLKAHLSGLIEFEPFYTRLITERRLLSENARNTYIMIQAAISFHIGLAAEREIKRGSIRPLPIDLLYNTWLGLIHHYLMNNDLFVRDGSVIDQYGSGLLQYYMSLIKQEGS